MNSRERLMASVNHKEPDRVARDMGATPSSGISALAYNDLVSHLGLDVGPAMVYDVVQQLAQPHIPVLDKFHIDVVDIGCAFNETPEHWTLSDLYPNSPILIPSWFHPVKESDGSHSVFHNDIKIATKPKTATFFDGTYVPYRHGIPQDLSDLDYQMDMILWQNMVHAPWDHASEPDFWEQLRARTLELRASTDRALMINCGCNMFEWGSFLRRIDAFFCDLMADEAGVLRLMDALMERHLKTLEKVCDAVGDIVDVLRFGDDLGMNTGPFMQPALYRKLFKPYHTRLNDYVHKRSNMKTFLHSCGSIYMLMPDLIEAGYDIINPVQVGARDMEAKRLKREFGKDITFWGGGCDTRTILNQGTEQQVRDHVKEMIDVFAPGGGFVFNSIHNILPDVPPQNIVAMFQAVDDFG